MAVYRATPEDRGKLINIMANRLERLVEDAEQEVGA